MSKVFDDFNMTSFWKRSDYATETYVSPPTSKELIASIESELGYKLPSSYIEFMEYQNGGIPNKTAYPAEGLTMAGDYAAVAGIFGIGKDKSCSLCGDLGSQFWIDEWGYPEIGIYFADCPSAGHDMICLDYRQCGKHGEPQVVHVDQECDYEITFLAENFETFIRGLVNEEQFQKE
jgi:hypothetical protein